MDHNATIGRVSLKSQTVLTGHGPHVCRTWPVQPGLPELPGGLLVARDATGLLAPYGSPQSTAAAGDGALKTFSFDLDGPQDPGTVTVTDGVETFTDNGCGDLVGSAGGTGQVNYQSGLVRVAFFVAPVAEAAVVCASQPVVAGILAQPVPQGQVLAEVLVLGPVNRRELRVGLGEAATAPTPELLRHLERSLIWPVG